MGGLGRESRLDTLCCLIGRILSKGQEKGKGGHGNDMGGENSTGTLVSFDGAHSIQESGEGKEAVVGQGKWLGLT